MIWNDFKDKLVNIDPSKKCLEFLANRVLEVRYRGMHGAQHHRHSFEQVLVCAEEMYKLVGNGIMQIRDTDLKKRPWNTPGEKIYAKYVNNVNKKLGKCTQDSIRKNLFVDYHRMGLIKRYDNSGKLIKPFEVKHVKYVRLSELGLDFINSSDIFEQNMLYIKMINTLTNNLANDLLDILVGNSMLEIDVYDFMFFLSFNGYKIGSKTYFYDELIEYMIEFHNLPRAPKTAVVDLVKSYCQPSAFSGNKKNKKDFDNWKNEEQELFSLIGDTYFFECKDNKLYVKVGKDACYEDKTKLRRSQIEKDEYFKKHGVGKTKGYELHHIVPLCNAKNRYEFNTLDCWENMIYIDGYNHSKISQTNNKNIVLDFDSSNNIVLRDPASILPEIKCEFGRDVKYNTSLKKTMSAFNKRVI